MQDWGIRILKIAMVLLLIALMIANPDATGHIMTRVLTDLNHWWFDLERSISGK